MNTRKRTQRKTIAQPSEAVVKRAIREAYPGDRVSELRQCSQDQARSSRADYQWLVYLNKGTDRQLLRWVYYRNSQVEVEHA